MAIIYARKNKQIRTLKLQEMIDAGLGLVMEESKRVTTKCSQHAEMLSRRKWQFCPHCGKKLFVKRNCLTCGRNFLSIRAYFVHITAHKYPSNCPYCRSGRAYLVQQLRGIHYQKALPEYRCKACNRYFKWTAENGYEKD